MAVIGFRQRDGTIRSADVTAGSLMEAALDMGVSGIEGQCGGFLACATCHVHLPDEWRDRVGPATADEVTMLEFEPHFTPASRLSCQLSVCAEFDGLIVDIPGGVNHA